MNFPLPPDKDWEYIAELTGDASWDPRRYDSTILMWKKLNISLLALLVVGSTDMSR